MILFLSTVISALCFGYALFKIYHFCLMTFLKKMNWKLEDLKNYTVTPTMQFWDKVFQATLLIGIIWKVFYT